MFPRIFKSLQYRCNKVILKRNNKFLQKRQNLFQIFFRRFARVVKYLNGVFVIVDYCFVLFYYKLDIKNQRFLIWDILNF